MEPTTFTAALGMASAAAALVWGARALGRLKAPLPRNPIQRISEYGLDGRWGRALDLRARLLREGKLEGMPPMLELKLSEAAYGLGRIDEARRCWGAARDGLQRHGTAATLLRLVSLAGHLTPVGEHAWLCGLVGHPSAEVRAAVDRRLDALKSRPRLARKSLTLEKVPDLPAIPAPNRPAPEGPAWAGAPSWERPQSPRRPRLARTGEPVWTPPASKPPPRVPWTSGDWTPVAPWE